VRGGKERVNVSKTNTFVFVVFLLCIYVFITQLMYTYLLHAELVHMCTECYN